MLSLLNARLIHSIATSWFIGDTHIVVSNADASSLNNLLLNYFPNCKLYGNNHIRYVILEPSKPKLKTVDESSTEITHCL